MSTATPNTCLLHYAADSGTLHTGQKTRIGDTHDMSTLLIYDMMPRLLDAAICSESPEMYLIRSWRDRLAKDRLDAEAWLGYSPEHLRRFWQSTGRRGQDAKKLFEVLPSSEEFAMIRTMFRSQPVEQAAYCGLNYEAWWALEVLKIERVENGSQADNSAKAYYESLKSSIEEQDIFFEPGVHTRWAFHGTEAIDSIVNDPVTGFQPLTSGARTASLWGSGTYFARDAKYCAEGGFCTASEQGHRRMLVVLLATGMPCVGDPNHIGVLPLRQGNSRYNSSIDYMSNPEVFIIQHPAAAYAAYVITFR
jgi:hypothetical protein